MAAARNIKKLVTGETPANLPVGEEDVNLDAVESVVKRMKKQMAERAPEESPERAAEIRQMVELGPSALKIKTGEPDELLNQTGFVRAMGKLFLALQAPLDFMARGLVRIGGDSLRHNLAASDMVYSPRQYAALAIASIFLMEMISIVLVLALTFIFKLSFIIPLVFLLLIPFMGLLFSVMVPASRAAKLAAELDKQLPFALRHMSIEIRAGVGIYKTMESVSSSGYGPVSDGFKYVLFSIEKGIPTEQALENWAERTRSDGLKRAVSHLVRALRTGGNLSQIMVTIAEDVAFERRIKIADYAEKLNLLSLFIMMVGIVLPVMMTVLTSIGSSPSIQGFLATFSFFSPLMLGMIYFVLVPALLISFIIFIKGADPGS
ncbi:type II secretion system F family protein [Candidatus Micrarchaeota archaeon]|nr:type II secretion system F family protein [Candidatus Micrarchaeota archaeon]